MNTTLTPPPGPPSPPVPPSATPHPEVEGAAPSAKPPTGAAKVVSILTIAFGVLVILGTVLSSLWSTLAGAATGTSTRSLAVAGVEDLEISASAGSLRVEFSQIDEAELEVTSPWGWDRWTFETDEDSLVVRSPDSWIGGGWWLGRNGDAVLRLPQSLEGADADLDLAGGELVVDGAFGEIDLNSSAGRAELAGSTRELTVEVTAGRADLVLDGVGDARFSVSAGAVDAELTGRPPSSVEIEVSAGSMGLLVPDGDYLISADSSAGTVEDRIGSTPGARNTIQVQSSAGQVVLRTS